MTEKKDGWAWYYDAKGRLIAKDLHSVKFRQRIKPSKKVYKRKPKHKGTENAAD